jgi:hypothetical protein
VHPRNKWVACLQRSSKRTLRAGRSIGLFSQVNANRVPVCLTKRVIASASLSALSAACFVTASALCECDAAKLEEVYEPVLELLDEMQVP